MTYWTDSLEKIFIGQSHDDDFFKLLIESPQDVGIVGVSDFIKSDELMDTTSILLIF